MRTLEPTKPSWRHARGATALCVAGALASCNAGVKTRGQLMVAVSTDLSIVKDMDQIEVEVFGADGSALTSNSYDIRGLGLDGRTLVDGFHMPATVAIVPPDSGGQRVRVRVTAKSTVGGADKARVVREAILRIPQDRVALLQMPLRWLCADQVVPAAHRTYESTCYADDGHTTCGGGDCVVADVDTNALPDYSPEKVFGGGRANGKGGTRIDVPSCFGNEPVVDLRKSDCSVALPDGADLGSLNVAMVLPPNSDGHCLDTADGPATGKCYLPLDVDDAAAPASDAGASDAVHEGFFVSGDRIYLPRAVCRRPLVEGVAVSRSCKTKDLSIPVCGPWTGWSQTASSQSENDAGTGTCGNGLLDPGEVCDSNLLVGTTCATATMGLLPHGTLTCRRDCTGFDVSRCIAAGGGGGANGSGGAPNTVGAGGGPSGSAGTAPDDGGSGGTGVVPVPDGGGSGGTGVVPVPDGGGSGGTQGVLQHCTFGSTDPCVDYTDPLGSTVQLGSYGAQMDFNVGKGFENKDPNDDATCPAFAAIFGEDPTLTNRVLDVGTQPCTAAAPNTGSCLDFKLYSVYRPATWPSKPVPVISWGNGTCLQPESYGAVLRYVASYGFFIVAANSREVGTGDEIRHGLDFATAANSDPSSPYHGHLDMTKIGVMGHSQGSTGAGVAAADSRVKSVILFNGGDKNPKPVLSVSGDLDLNGYTAATMSADLGAMAAYLYYHNPQGMGSIRGNLVVVLSPQRVEPATLAWWQMMLQSDATARKMFVGANCGLCGHANDYDYGAMGL